MHKISALNFEFIRHVIDYPSRFQLAVKCFKHQNHPIFEIGFEPGTLTLEVKTSAQNTWSLLPVIIKIYDDDNDDEAGRGKRNKNYHC